MRGPLTGGAVPPPAPVGVLLAVDGPLETVAATALAGATGLRLVRRCADLAELLSAAEAGLGRLAVVSGGFGRVDADAVARLRRSGCRVAGVVDPDRDNGDRLRAIGVRDVVEVSVLDADEGGRALVEGLRRLAAPALSQAGPPAEATPAAGDGADGAGAAAAPGDGDWFVPLDAATGTPGATPGPTTGAAPGGATSTTGAAAPGSRRAGRDADPGWADVVAEGPAPPGPAATPPAVPAAPSPREREGSVVTVWGAPGSPGRTLTAVTLASELAALGRDVLLVDADTHAASVAAYLGILDESAGIVAAVRAGVDGRLTPGVLEAAAPLVLPRLRVLTGITRSARWPELRPVGFEAVLTTASRAADCVVVDVAAPLERDDELSVDVAAPRRNALTLTALERADTVLAVGSADPIGLQRLVRALQDLQSSGLGPAPRVVANRLRASAVGDGPARRVTQALTRFAGVADVVLVPEDRPGVDRAVLAGRCLAEAVPSSPVRAPLRALAAELAGVPAPAGSRRRHRAAAPS